jgi:hypothetical protein
VRGSLPADIERIIDWFTDDSNIAPLSAIDASKSVGPKLQNSSLLSRFSVNRTRGY